MMIVEHVPEPELEFGNEGRHIDIRFGLANYGPLDIGSSDSPRAIRTGVIGTASDIDAVRKWLERCRGEIPGKKSRYGHLFPAFPGFAADRSFRSELQVDEKLLRPLSSRDVAPVVALDRKQAVDAASRLFAREAAHLVETARPDVIIAAPPRALLDAVDAPADDPVPIRPRPESPRVGPFHDVMKAALLPLGIPVQMMRPETYDERQKPKQRGRSWLAQGTQDEATRAWNVHTAIYYKAGGIPWRLRREATDLTACYVGISFYRSLEADRLQISVAQVFNERGDGMIMRGGPAEIEKRDKTPHLGAEDAARLLSASLAAYRREHKTLPARVVVHKSSYFTPAELDGAQSALAKEGVDSADLVSISDSGVRLFRSGSFPPLRGSRLVLDDSSNALYTRGSIDFFGMYPGMYVPSPVLLRYARVEQSQRMLASEILALTKMNWNNTQFDGALPITLRAAKQVGDILRCVPESAPVPARYAFYM